jgi:RNA polymerase sigma factor (TIGR02999 family)
MGELTLLIERAHQGDAEARDAVYKLLYVDLSRIARARLMRSGRNTMLDTSSLVNEAYIRLARVDGLASPNRHHFLAYASRVMHSVIVDLVRARATERRGSSAQRVTLNTNLCDDIPAGEDELLRVHDALEELAAVDERLVRMVEMRYFAGLTEKETADVLGVNERTVRRDWQKARMLLAAALK